MNPTLHNIQKDKYMNTKWDIRKITENDTMSVSAKYSEIKTILTHDNFSEYTYNSEMSIHGRIYLFLYRHKLISFIMLLERILSSNFRAIVTYNYFVGNFKYHFLAKTWETDIKKEDKKIIITLVPNHGNLGDLAIGFAQRKFIDDNFNTYKVIEVTCGQTLPYLKDLKRKSNPNDIIVVSGGGDFGNLYEDVEFQRKFIIKKFPKNKIVSFPQSIFFTKDTRGQKKFQESIETYSKHTNLHLLARDNTSYRTIKTAFSHNSVTEMPDIALYLHESRPIVRDENRITISLRRDIESSLKAIERDTLINELKKQYSAIDFYDTNIDNLTIDLNDRESMLEDIWSKYRESAVVVTDRLHGVVFCAITKTPCVAINNNNGKVKNLCKRWLLGLNFISVVDSFDVGSILAAVKRVSTIQPSNINQVNLNKEYKILEEIVRL